MNAPQTPSLPLVVESIDALVELLQLQNRLLTEKRPVPEALPEQIDVASKALAEAVERCRRESEGQTDLSGRPSELRARLERQFMLAFRLTRENEALLRASDQPARPAAAVAPRPSLREIERRYRERMRQSESGFRAEG